MLTKTVMLREIDVVGHALEDIILTVGTRIHVADAGDVSIERK